MKVAVTGPHYVFLFRTSKYRSKEDVERKEKEEKAVIVREEERE